MDIELEERYLVRTFVELAKMTLQEETAERKKIVAYATRVAAQKAWLPLVNRKRKREETQPLSLIQQAERRRKERREVPVPTDTDRIINEYAVPLASLEEGQETTTETHTGPWEQLMMRAAKRRAASSMGTGDHLDLDLSEYELEMVPSPKTMGSKGLERKGMPWDTGWTKARHSSSPTPHHRTSQCNTMEGGGGQGRGIKERDRRVQY